MLNVYFFVLKAAPTTCTVMRYQHRARGKRGARSVRSVRGSRTYPADHAEYSTRVDCPETPTAEKIISAVHMVASCVRAILDKIGKFGIFLYIVIGHCFAAFARIIEDDFRLVFVPKFIPNNQNTSYTRVDPETFNHPKNDVAIDRVNHYFTPPGEEFDDTANTVDKAEWGQLVKENEAEADGDEPPKQHIPIIPNYEQVTDAMFEAMVQERYVDQIVSPLTRVTPTQTPYIPPHQKQQHWSIISCNCVRKFGDDAGLCFSCKSKRMTGRKNILGQPSKNIK